MFLGGSGFSPPKPFIYASPAEIQLLLMIRERGIFNNHELITGTSMLFRTHTSSWSETLAKGPYRKNTSSAMRLEPVILRMLIQPFYQLSYPDP